jgi:hypothetical protein
MRSSPATVARTILSAVCVLTILTACGPGKSSDSPPEPGDVAAAKVGDRVQVYADIHDSRSDELRIPGYAWTEAAKEYFEAEGEPVDESRDRLPNSGGY